MHYIIGLLGAFYYINGFILAADVLTGFGLLIAGPFLAAFFAFTGFGMDVITILSWLFIA